MPKVKKLRVADLSLDPKNFRHMPQRTEEKAVHAMAALDSTYFWGLAESLLDNGYLELENVVVLDAGDGSKPTVKEGNRRIGILKLAHGLVKGRDLAIPETVAGKLEKISKEWLEKNAEVPCLVYTLKETDAADEIVAITHGKGQKAARLDWNAVATARHNRSRGASEHALDLLEKYILKGENLTPEEGEKWAAEYHLTVLHNALNLLAPRMDFDTARKLVDAYPKLPKYRKELESIIRDIGLIQIKTDTVRESNFAVNYGIPLLPDKKPAASQPGQQGSSASTNSNPGSSSAGTTASSNAAGNANTAGENKPAKQSRSVTPNSQVAIRRSLRSLNFRGAHRNKLVDLRDEALKIKIAETPLAFCFLMRCIFELSAKAYCTDYATSGGPQFTTAQGDDRKLKDVLDEVVKHITNSNPVPGGKPNRALVKELHGAMVELASPSSPLSVTSLNQLIHHPSFSLTEKHICSVFSNLFPLLAKLNR